MTIQAYPHAVWDPELNSYIEYGEYDDKYYSFEYKGKFFYQPAAYIPMPEGRGFTLRVGKFDAPSW